MHRTVIALFATACLLAPVAATAGPTLDAVKGRGKLVCAANGTSANTTWPPSRDAKLGLDFTAPTFYDGQGFMVSKKLNVASVKEMNGATVCVLPGSTSEKVAAEVAKANNITFNMLVIEN